MNELQKKIDWAKGDGLVPAIVQHAVSGRVLMLGYMNVDALAQTQISGWVTFFSRSRQCLWTKGETSGNKLAQLVSVGFHIIGGRDERPGFGLQHLGDIRHPGLICRMQHVPTLHGLTLALQFIHTG